MGGFCRPYCYTELTYTRGTMRYKSAFLLVLLILTSGCFSPVETPYEAEQTVEAAAATTAADSFVPAVSLTEEQDELLCDHSADRVENPEYSDYIDEVDSFLLREDFQGAVLVAKGEELIFAAGYGYADEVNGALCTARDTFELGSLSKQMTAAAILQLSEQNKLSVYDTLDKYFPEYEHGKNITIQDLLRMRSGLFDFLNSPANFFPADFVEEFSERADAADESLPDFSRDFLLEYLYDAPLEGNPDDYYSYSNTNYYLLGLIIEQVSGMSYQEYMQKNIFDPCGMLTANNGFRCTTARGYYEDGTTLSMRTSTALGCGSVNGSVYDMYCWLTHLLNGDVISKQSLKEMLTAVDGYGYGIRCDDGFAYHLGNTDVFNAYAMVHLEQEFVVIVLTNSPKTERAAGLYAAPLFEMYYE